MDAAQHSEYQLFRSEDIRLLTIVSKATDRAVLVLDTDGNTIYVNDAFTKIFGYESHEIAGKRPAAFLLKPGTNPSALERVCNAGYSNSVFTEDLFLCGKNGSELRISSDVSPVLDEDGKAINLVLFLSDVTESRNIQRLQRDVLEAVARGVDLADVADLICRRAEALAPEVQSSLLRIDAEGCVHPLAAPSLPKEYSAALDGMMMGPNAGSCGTAAFSGQPVCVTDISTDPRWEQYRAMVLPLGLHACWSSPIKLRDGHVVGTFAFYYTEKRGPSHLHQEIVAACLHLAMLAFEAFEARQQITQLSHFDPLTALPNRPYFSEMASDLLARGNGEEACFFALDIDHFKDINNTFGHAAGDRILLEIAYRLRSLAQPHGLISRTAGDAFALMLPDCGASRASSTADRILEVLQAPLDISGFSSTMTASIGISTSLGNTSDARVLLEQAVTAMLQAKANGRSCYHFYSTEMNRMAKDRLVLGTALRSALAADALRLEYQPKVDLRTHELVGVEALSRWTNQELGEIPPGRFIPLAEEIGQIEAIGLWSLREACAQMAAWRTEALPVPSVAVNLSPAHFLNQDLVPFIAGLLEEFHLPAQSLTLEITESVMSHHLARAIETAHALRALGVSISMDDFGTGFSSLDRLSRFPLQELKLDRSFITNFEKDLCSQAVTNAVISIGRSLGINIVCEGVETQEQADMLLSLGCRIAQGYFFSKAMPPEKLKFWLQEQQPMPLSGLTTLSATTTSR